MQQDNGMHENSQYNNSNTDNSDIVSFTPEEASASNDIDTASGVVASLDVLKFTICMIQDT